ncbi:MAG: NUDIX hydrolase [Candidatus Micrarchaeia archaeon]
MALELRYKGNVIKVYTGKDRIKKKEINYERVVEANAIVVLPIFKNYILLEKQFRPAIMKYIYELPAGHIRKGEKPTDAAKREMNEETGYMPKKLKFMFKAYPEPGISTSVQYFYLATEFEKGRRRLDKDEIIKVKKVGLEDALEMIEKKKIIDLKTVAAILFYKKYF